MVHCDGCGTTADSNDKYCRICGRILTPLPPTPHVTDKRKRKSESTHYLVAHEIQSSDLDLVVQRKEASSVVSPAIREQTSDMRIDLHGSHQEGKLSGNELGSVNTKPKLITASRKIVKSPVTLAIYFMAAVGGISLLFSIVTGSSILAFIGLGLIFWGALLLFIRPRKYVRSDLMDSTALSSLKTVDRVMTEFGYNQRAIYIPRQNPEKVIAFVPQNTLTDFSKLKDIKDQTFIDDPKGITIIPPGLELSNLIERELGIEFGKTSLKTLSERLPKLLTEDLEIFQNFEMKVEDNTVHIKFEEPIYSELCKKLRDCTSICSSLGCPICSAMACVLAQASGKPVAFDKDVRSSDGRTTESTYMIHED